MSIGYKKRKKAIRDEKKRLLLIDGLDKFGHIPRLAFRQLQADWYRELTGPPIGTLADFVRQVQE